jgi:hypothetical protein
MMRQAGRRAHPIPSPPPHSPARRHGWARQTQAHSDLCPSPGEHARCWELLLLRRPGHSHDDRPDRTGRAPDSLPRAVWGRQGWRRRRALASLAARLCAMYCQAARSCGGTWPVCRFRASSSLCPRAVAPCPAACASLPRRPLAPRPKRRQVDIGIVYSRAALAQHGPQGCLQRRWFAAGERSSGLDYYTADSYITPGPGAPCHARSP